MRAHVVSPVFRGREWLRLFVSYQRYGMLLVALALAPFGLVYALAPTKGWWWLVAAIPAAWVGRFAIVVLGRFRKKLRMTALATRRIAQGTFSPQSVATSCEDPCSRVVAHEILRRAGLPGAERRTLVAQFRQQSAASASGMLIFDHERGTVTHIDGEGRMLATTSAQRSEAEPT